MNRNMQRQFFPVVLFLFAVGPVAGLFFAERLIAQSPAAASPGIDPLVLGLREALYADATLEELVDQLSILPAVNRPIELTRAGKPRAALTILEKRPDRDAFVPLVARIFAYRSAGDRGRSLQLVGNLIQSRDSRIALQGYRLRREMDTTPLKSLRLAATGALVEFGDSKEPLVVAGYQDGQARLYFRDGSSAQDDGRKPVQTAARSFTKAMGARSAALGPEKNRSLPGQGKVRFVLLTPESIAVKVTTVRAVQDPSHPLAQPYASARDLIKSMAGSAHKKP